MFQSLVGFKINWNERLLYRLDKSERFQSLVGFKINWNKIFPFMVKKRAEFQSLVGFKINWNKMGSRQEFEKIFSCFNP